MKTLDLINTDITNVDEAMVEYYRVINCIENLLKNLSTSYLELITVLAVELKQTVAKF